MIEIAKSHRRRCSPFWRDHQHSSTTQKDRTNARLPVTLFESRPPWRPDHCDGLLLWSQAPDRAQQAAAILWQCRGANVRRASGGADRVYRRLQRYMESGREHGCDVTERKAGRRDSEDLFEQRSKRRCHQLCTAGHGWRGNLHDNGISTLNWLVRQWRFGDIPSLKRTPFPNSTVLEISVREADASAAPVTSGSAKARARSPRRLHRRAHGHDGREGGSERRHRVMGTSPSRSTS